MTWVRMQPFITNWPGGGSPPVFEINSDENGTAVVELAWDPQALMAPASYQSPMRYYSTNVTFSATVPRASGGGNLSITVPQQTITLNGNRATWAMPADLWAGYVEESLKTLGGGPPTTFSGNIYYRIRLTAPGAGVATIWPADAVLNGPSAAAAPHIGVLRLSATTASQVVPDEAAVNGMGGIPGIAPTLWSSLLRGFWTGLPESDPVRMSLVAIFAHAAFRAAPLGTRSDVLKLWLLAGRSRQKVPNLLSRQVVTGSNITTPIINKIAYKGGKNLVQNLLAILNASPHPDLGARTREQIIDDVVTEILDPNGQVNQGNAGLCVPTSIQAFLININPAEYARLQVGWLSAAGSAELADGSTATVPPGVLQIARYSRTVGTFTPTNAGFLYRTFSEMAFQGAMMKFGEGSSFPTSDGTEAQIQAVFQHVYAGGLNQDGTKKVLDGLFGVSFRKSTMAWPITVATPGIQAAITGALVADMTLHPQQCLLAVYWSTAPSTPVPVGTNAATFFSTHAVVPIRNDGGRIFFKNPQYAGSTPSPSAVAGGFNTNPPRRYDDPTSSLESITVSDLNQWIYWYLVSDTALI